MGKWLNVVDYNKLFISILFGHYLLQFIYSPRPMVYFYHKSRPGDRFVFVILRMIFLLFLFYIFNTSKNFAIVTTFGIHFVFTEVYIREFINKSKTLHFFSFLTSISLYSYFLFDSYPFKMLDKGIYFTVFIISILFMLLSSINKTKEVRSLALFIALYDLLGFMFVYLLLPSTNQLMNIIFYHLLWWFYYSIYKKSNKVSLALAFKDIFKFVFVNLLITGFFGWFFYYNVLNAFDLGFKYGNLVGSIHIISSFFLSVQNPQWINWLFGKKVEPVPSYYIMSEDAK